MKLTKKQIEIIRKQTREELKGQQKSICVTLGFFHPTAANWCWVAGWTFEGDLVVTRFGEVM